MNRAGKFVVMTSHKAAGRPSELAPRWEDAHLYSPAPRHRRRLILNWVLRLQSKSVLDAGCAQPYLLQEIERRCHIPVFGCDFSERVIQRNRSAFPQMEFEVVDLSGGSWPGGRLFDLVICSEVLEHIDRWQDALGNVAGMATRHLLLTAPSGKVYPIDRHIGHYRHFAGPELEREVKSLGFHIVRTRHWGFPVHSLYKMAINLVDPIAIYDGFAEGTYGLFKRTLSAMIYRAFFINDLFRSGGLYMLLGQRQLKD